MEIHPPADVIVVAVHLQNALAAIDPERPDQPLAEFISSGEKPHLSPYAALEYSPRLQQLVYYSARDKASVYCVEVHDGAHWRQITAADSLDPIADAARQSSFEVNRAHTFGRFRIASFADFDLAILVRHVDTPVYAMRLPD